MRKFLKVSAILAGIFAVYLFVSWIDTYVYPFRADSPNFSDIEKSFDKILFPSDWKEIASSENRGIKGRGCDPYNSSGCFHKSKTFTVPDKTDKEQVVNIMKDFGCSGVNVKPNNTSGDLEDSYSFECGIGDGIYISGSLRGPKNETYISVRSY